MVVNIVRLHDQETPWVRDIVGTTYYFGMTDSLLRSLRDRALDETEPLAGLLRKCLLLGAETGSSALRDWARLELNGYTEESTIPDYRKLSGVPITVDSISGNTWTKGQVVTRWQLPEAAQEYVPEFVYFTQPIEEVERQAHEKSLRFKPPGLAAAQSVWDRELGPFQSIVNMSYILSGTSLSGLLGQIRTNLIDVIADLTVTTPLTELPRREDVDAAMQQRIGHVGDVYTTTVVHPSGPTAIGAGATASTGLSISEVLRLLDAVKAAARTADADTTEVEAAVAALSAAVSKPAPETGEVIKRTGKLREVADKLGIAAVSSATGAAVSALTDLAMNGAFG